jgi:hypothetical protein
MLPVLSRMPQAQNVDFSFPDLVAHFVPTYEDASDLAVLEFLKTFADARMFK